VRILPFESTSVKGLDTLKEGDRFQDGLTSFNIRRFHAEKIESSLFQNSDAQPSDRITKMPAAGSAVHAPKFADRHDLYPPAPLLLRRPDSRVREIHRRILGSLRGKFHRSFAVNI
jgi:hypothetical protein